MVKVKGIKYDVKTKREEIVEEDIELPQEPSTSEIKGIDFQKLKKVLKQKGIINDESEIE